MKKIITAFIVIMLLNLSCESPKIIEINLHSAQKNRQVVISIDIGPQWVHVKPYNAVPQFALWWEDKKGNYIDTIFVTHKAAKDGWLFSDGSRRPESLPVWSHHRGVLNEDGGYMPSKKMPLPDSVTAATPRPEQQAIITTGTNGENNRLYLYCEVNHSCDWNMSYPENAESGADNYSHANGQPSVIYRAEVDFSESGDYVLEPLGTGDLNGKDGTICYDLTKLTSALRIVDKIKVKIH